MSADNAHVAAIGAYADAVLAAAELGIANPHEVAATVPADVIAAGGDRLKEALQEKGREAAEEQRRAARPGAAFDDEIRQRAGR